MIADRAGTISIQLAEAHDTFGHKKEPLKGVPHWNSYLKILDEKRGYTAENPLIIPIPINDIHTIDDSTFLDVSMIPINPKGEIKKATIKRP